MCEEEKKTFNSVQEMMDYMESQLTLWDKIMRATVWRVYGIWSGILYWIRRKWQKMRKGYSMNEVWGLNMAVLDFVYPRIKAFKEENTHGYPCKLETYEEWQEIVDKIVNAFELWHEDEYGTQERDEEYYKNYEKRWEEITEGLELFGRWLPSLWD